MIRINLNIKPLFKTELQKLLLFIMLPLFAMQLFAVNEVRTVGNTGADYPTLRTAFAAINNGTLTGSVILRIIASTTETASAVLNASGTGSASYNSVIIYPTQPNVVISGNLNAPLIDLDGADNVTLDGRINATGFTKSLVVENTSTSFVSGVSTVRFINDASNNNFRFCIIRGSQTNTSTGVIFFSTSTVSTGNDGNLLTDNIITSCTDTNRAVNTIYSEGSPNRENTLNTITNNAIFNFFNRTVNSCGVNIAANSSGFNISNNSFYETTAFEPTASVGYTAININNSTGTAFQVHNNFIGGTAELCSGTALIKNSVQNNAFTGIFISVGNSFASSVQGNKISNLEWNNISAGNWVGIMAQTGTINIGTSTGNTIGENAGSGVLKYNLSSLGGLMCGIQINSNDAVNCNNNLIGAISISNANRTIGIFKNSSTGNTFIQNNLIGSANTINSILVTGNPINVTQFVTGIQMQGFDVNTVNSNTISNITATSTGTGFVRGIEVLSGSNSVTNNIISRLKTAASNAISLHGLSFTNSSYDNLISGNQISDIENTSSTYNGNVTGMTLQCSGTNTVSKNFIHSIQVHSSSTNASVYGVRTETGTATYSNNIIRLGGNTQTTIYGVYESGSQTCNLYHNTIYIDGNPTAGIRRSYALYSATNTNTIDYQNNLFINVRSNSGASGNHYSAYFNYTTEGSLTLDYNVYFANGNGGYIGNFANVNINSLPLISGQDAQSISVEPGFQNPGGNGSADYKLIYTKLNGKSGTGVTEDFGGNLRSGAPTIGAWEFSGDNMWKGNVSTDWGNPLNWTLAMVPAYGSDINFDPYPKNNLVLDVNRTVNDINLNQNVYRVDINGKTLTVLGNLNFTNSAKINAAPAGSTISFEGSVQQTLKGEDLTNNELYNLIINNSNNIVLSGTLVLLNQIFSISGRLDAYQNNPTVIYRGSAAQAIVNTNYVNNRITELIIDNASGVSLNTTLEVLNNMTINSGKLFTISQSGRLKVNINLINNAGVTGLIIHSNASGTGSLIHFTDNVPATVRRYIGGTAAAWHFLTSPVNSQALSGEWKPVGTYADGTGYDLYVWDEPSQCWIYNLNTTVAPTWTMVHSGSAFVPAKGYLYAVQALNTTKSFVGNLNNGDVTFGLTSNGTGTYKGYNFVGNPYPSSIDWKMDAGFNRSMLEQVNGGYTIWIWSNQNNNYGVYNSADVSNNGINGATRYISPAMGFFVKASNAGLFSFKNAARVHNEASNWMRSKALRTELSSISFAVQSNDSLGRDEVRLNFGSGYQDVGIDKMFSPVKSAPSLYFKDVDKMQSIRYVSHDVDTTRFELCFKPGKDGVYTIAVSNISLQSEVILLEDKILKKIIDLKQLESYTYNSKISDKPDRFNVYFTKSVSPDRLFDYIQPYINDSKIVVNLTGFSKSVNAIIYNTNGIEIYNGKLNEDAETKIPINQKGVLFLRLSSGGESKTYKLLN